MMDMERNAEIIADPSKVPRVLIVEDDMTLRIPLQKILERIHPEVRIDWLKTADEYFKSSKFDAEALRRTYDLVLTDIFMPGQSSGLEIWNHFAHAEQPTPIVLMSGLSEYEFFRVIGRSSKTPTYLEKPLDYYECRDIFAGFLLKRGVKESMKEET